MKPDFTLEFIKDFKQLRRLTETLKMLSAFVPDIETVDWRNRQRERIVLVRIAFRTGGKIEIVIIDALADFDAAPTRTSESFIYAALRRLMKKTDEGHRKISDLTFQTPSIH